MAFTSQLKGAEGQYKLVRKVLEHVCSSNNLNFEAVWASVSNRETEYFDRHFKRQKRRDDPLRQVKKPRTAFSFFTQANRNEIQTKHPNLSFGEVSKLVGEQWKNLDDKSRAKYIQLETEDKARYSVARKAVMEDIAAHAESASAATQQCEAVCAQSAPAQAAAPAKKSKSATKAAAPAAAPAATEPAVKKSKSATKAAAPAPAAAAAAPAATETAAKKSKSATKSAAAPAATTAAPAQAAAPAKKSKSATKTA